MSGCLRSSPVSKRVHPADTTETEAMDQHQQAPPTSEDQASVSKNGPSDLVNAAAKGSTTATTSEQKDARAAGEPLSQTRQLAESETIASATKDEPIGQQSSSVFETNGNGKVGKEDDSKPSTTEAGVAEQVEGQMFDRYGFRLEGEDSAPPLLTRKQVRVLRARENKWRRVLATWRAGSLPPKYRKKIKSRCRKGLPDSLRGALWPHLCGSQELIDNDGGRMEEMASVSLEQIIDEQQRHKVREFYDIIERDLHRTFPDHEQFSTKGGFGQQDLRDVLRAYVIYNPTLGYCQGMGMIAGMLLMHVDKVSAFWTLVVLLDKDKYLKGFFESGLVEIQLIAFMITMLLRRRFSHLANKLENEHVDPLMYMADWFLCAYGKTLPWRSVLRIWDMMMWEGRKVLFKTALAIFELHRKSLENDCPTLQELMALLRELPRKTTDEDTLIPAILDTKFSRAEMYELRRKAVAMYEEQRNTTYTGHQEPGSPVAYKTSVFEAEGTETKPDASPQDKRSGTVQHDQSQPNTIAIRRVSAEPEEVDSDTSSDDSIPDFDHESWV